MKDLGLPEADHGLAGEERTAWSPQCQRLPGQESLEQEEHRP